MVDVLRMPRRRHHAALHAGRCHAAPGQVAQGQVLGDQVVTLTWLAPVQCEQVPACAVLHADEAVPHLAER
jgi:hypothetical protein